MASNGAEESVGIDMENNQAVEDEAIGGEGKARVGQNNMELPKLHCTLVRMHWPPVCAKAIRSYLSRALFLSSFRILLLLSSSPIPFRSMEVSTVYRVANLVAEYYMLTSNQKFRHSLNFLY